MTKELILREIRRTAATNGGAPLGRQRFEQETGIRYHDWFGRYWARWSDAVREAGLTPNELRDAFSDEVLIEKLVALIREIGRFPGNGDLRIKKRACSSFPNDKVFDSHFGTRARLREAVIQYCRDHAGHDDVPPLCQPLNSKNEPNGEDVPRGSEITGFVYLIKYGRHYKIGKTNAAGRREYEVALQLPERVRTVHIIKTDDPDGIEEYWHKRFAAKRGNGEWFELDATDVQVFRRRKFM